MKIIHTGDVHLGAATRNLPLEKAAIRKKEILDSFRRLCAYAQGQGVAVVLIAGDLFDEERVDNALRVEVLSIIERSAPVCFFYARGNHDSGAFAQEGLPKNLYVFSKNRTWQSYDLPENITITGVDGEYLSAEKYRELQLRPERYNIVVLHGELAQNERAETGTIALTKLQGKYIDYLALGHIHIPMQQTARLDGRGVYRYCGCLEGRGFDECGKRGCFLLEIGEGRLLKEQFLSFATREVCEVAADISACETYYDVERAALSALQSVNAQNVVKLVLRGRHKAGLSKDVSLLASRLSQNFFFMKVTDESSIVIDYAAFQNDLSERGEFVREVCRYQMSESERAEILDVGLKALAGEDIDL